MIQGVSDPRPAKPIKAKRKRDRHASALDRPDQLLVWRIDWRDYFRRFDEAHGGNPMEVAGRLVYEDGWAYSMSDYRGPEWEPPSDRAELHALMTAYWEARLAEAESQLRELRQVKRNLDELTLLKSLPLTRRVKGEAGQSERQEIDGEVLGVRIAWLAADADNSREQIKLLKGAKDAKSIKDAVCEARR